VLNTIQSILVYISEPLNNNLAVSYAKTWREFQSLHDLEAARKVVDSVVVGFKVVVILAEVRKPFFSKNLVVCLWCDVPLTKASQRPSRS
jgi:hypothetical protein